MTSFAFRNSQLGSVVSASGDSFYTDISGVIFSDSSQLYSATGIAYSGNNISIFVNDSGYIQELSQDLTPQLGGDLDINANAITGIGNLNISGNITSNTGNLDVVSFNINNESILTKGQISWDDTEGTMDIGLTDNTSIHIGSHRYFRIRNSTGDVLYKGQAVYATGVHENGIIEPAKYVADGTVREVYFMGLMLEDVNDNNNGYAIDFGHLEEMDLDGSATNFAVGDETWNAGDILYVHPTEAGKLTKVEPKHSISVAIVLDAGNGNGNGRMFVRPTSYGHLDDNHDVAVSGATNGQFLQYNSATDYWIPSSSGNFTTLQVNGAFTFPTGDGSANQYLKTDGNGNVSWSSVAGAGSGTELSVTGSVALTTADITGVGNINVYLDGSTIKISGSGGGGGGTLDGVGLSNYTAKWSDSDTLTSGIIYDNGTNVGIGTSSPSYNLDVNGTFSANSINVNDQFTFPTTDGSANQYLKTDGNGNVSWSNVSGGGGGVSISGYGDNRVLTSDGTSDGINAESKLVFIPDPSGNKLGIGTTNPNGNLSISNGSFGVDGDSQKTFFTARAFTSDSTTTTLFLDGSSTKIQLPPKSVWNFNINLCCFSATNEGVASWNFRGCVKRNSSTTAIVGSLIEENFIDVEINGVIASVAANSGTNSLDINVAGLDGHNMRWTAGVDMVQTTYAIDNYNYVYFLPMMYDNDMVP